MCNYNGQKLFLQSTRIHFRISAEWSLTVFRSPTEATILESGDQAQPLIFAFDFRVRIKLPPSSKSQSLSVESWEADTRRRLPSRAKLRSLIIPVWSIRSSFRHPAKKCINSNTSDQITPISFSSNLEFTTTTGRGQFLWEAANVIKCFGPCWGQGSRSIHSAGGALSPVRSNSY